MRTKGEEDAIKNTGGRIRDGGRMLASSSYMEKGTDVEHVENRVYAEMNYLFHIHFKTSSPQVLRLPCLHIRVTKKGNILRENLKLLSLKFSQIFP